MPPSIFTTPRGLAAAAKSEVDAQKHSLKTQREWRHGFMTVHTPPNLRLHRAHDTTRKIHFRIAISVSIILGYIIILMNRGTAMLDPDNSQTAVNHSEPTQTIFLPFVHRFSAEQVPLVKTDVDNVPIQMPVDTGSTGVLVGAEVLPHVDITKGEAAYHYLTSSSILYIGQLIDLPITFHGSNGTRATASVPVLVVTESWICPWYDPTRSGFECPQGPNGETPVRRDTSGITYMGVGFGRNRLGDGQPRAQPKGNPFLNIDSVNGRKTSPGSMHTGYTISTKGIHLGLTESNSRGFAFVPLGPGVTHGEDARDWAMVKMRFTIDGEQGHVGDGLVDTGIAQMYIRAEEGASVPNVTVKNPNENGHAECVKRVTPGTGIAIGFPAANGSMVGNYAFVVGKRSTAMSPSYVVPARQGPRPFVNTGRSFLFGYSVAFDAVGGRFGFRPVGSSSSL